MEGIGTNHEIPEHLVTGINFRFYSTEEIKQLSVKEITNPVTFDQLSQPTFGGLYDPALGPSEQDDACITCGQGGLYCPGHMGHIELPITTFNPVFFNTMYQILRMSCMLCHRMLISPTMANLFIGECRLLEHNRVTAVEDLQELVSQQTTQEVGKKAAVDEIVSAAITEFTEKALADGKESDVSIKSVHGMRNKITTDLFQNHLKRTKSCLHCKGRLLQIRQEHMSKIVLLGKLNNKELVTPRKNGKNPMPEADSDDNNDDEYEEIGSTRKKRGRMAQETQDAGKEKDYKENDVTLLTAVIVREHLRQTWKNDGPFLQRLYGSLAKCQAQSPVDIFFLDVVPVPPTKFRPPAVMKGRKLNNDQTENYNLLLHDSATFRDILQTMKKSDMDSVVTKEAVVPSSVHGMPGKTLLDKLNNAWTRLQVHVNAVIDSTLDRECNRPGIKQLLEKKEGLLRKNMMGKRVNYAARSVISPDPNLNTNEIGIPEVFAKALTFPQPVTPWNVHELRQAVINGPNVHPGACYVVNEDGFRVMLSSGDKAKRLAVAKSLLNPSTSSRAVFPQKKVYRHLKNGDVLLINRQPTLHRPSIQAHRARVLRGEKTLRLHYANCKAYNADFDGDEMNAHFPQNEIARAEAYNIASTDYQYLVPKDGMPLAGLIQDHMVSGVTLTLRGRFFNREDYCRLVYTALIDKNGPFQLLPPTILKPYRLWSGKQVLSTVVLNVIPANKPALSLMGKAKVPEKSWIKVKTSSRNSVTPEHMGESDVVIRQGELLVGVLDKGHYGPTPYGLIHSCYELYGGQVAGKMLTCFGRLFLNFLQMRGFTLGVEDILVTKTADKKRQQIVRNSPLVGKEVAQTTFDPEATLDDDALTRQLKEAQFTAGSSLVRELDMNMRNKTNKIQDDIVRTCMPGGLQQLFPSNNLQLMVQTGAKGSSVNCMQISCLLGQIELEGKRPPMMLSGRTLPSFLPYDFTPRAGGFVTGRFLTGIRQQEYFFHCMAGREGLVDTAVKTSRSGYLQRCLIKHLEGVCVNYDLTVRDSDGSIIQFYYGEDGLDITKTSYLTPKQFPFLLENLQLDPCKLDSEDKKVHKLKKAMRKWKKNNSSAPDVKLRTSGFLQFCETVSSVGRPKSSSVMPGRSSAAMDTCSAWQQLSEKQRTRWDKNSHCPDPVLSQITPYHCGAVPEKQDKILTNYAKHELSKHAPDVSAKQFTDVLNARLKEAVVDPGESVGLLCAQSIGEPSTQMTLNTFHFAGRGEMNVTLGIPRLREILMVGSRNMLTPAMDVPVRTGPHAKAAVKELQKQLTKVTLNEVLKDINVAEYLSIKSPIKHERKRMFRVRFNFLPHSCYKDRLVVTPGHILRYMERTYFRRLLAVLKKKISAISKSRILSHGTQRRKESAPESAPAADNDEEEEEDIEDNEGGAAAEKAFQRKNEEQEYDMEEENGAELEEEDAVDMDDEDDAADADEDGLDQSKTSSSSNLEREYRKVSATTEGERIKAVLNQHDFVSDYKFDTKRQLWSEITFQLPLLDSKIDVLALITADIGKWVVHEVSGISRCILGDQNGPNGPELHLKTEGINIHELYKHGDILDLNRLYCNDIHGVADAYGIEAANRIIMKEIQAVFAAYGIEVDYRHLSLLADYMTCEGSYKPFNRFSMNSNPSPLQQMSFETTVQFLVNASINGKMDKLKSPSSQIVLGKVISTGTGSFDLIQPLAS